MEGSAEDGNEVQRKVRQAVRRILLEHTAGQTELHNERGVYNFYLEGVNMLEECCANESGECRQEARHRHP